MQAISRCLVFDRRCDRGFDCGADVGLGVAAGTDVMQRRYARKLHRALCKLAEGAASY
jgi:hypothetical protein